jgi:hypothetical protein
MSDRQFRKDVETIVRTWSRVFINLDQLEAKHDEYAPMNTGDPGGPDSTRGGSGNGHRREDDRIERQAWQSLLKVANSQAMQSLSADRTVSSYLNGTVPEMVKRPSRSKRCGNETGTCHNLPSFGWPTSKPNGVRGRCQACYTFLHRHRTDRTVSK